MFRQGLFPPTLNHQISNPERQNKPNGQFQLDFDPKVIKEFMRDLSIRKVPGIGRVNERLLEAIGIKASRTSCII